MEIPKRRGLKGYYFERKVCTYTGISKRGWGRFKPITLRGGGTDKWYNSIIIDNEGNVPLSQKRNLYQCRIKTLREAGRLGHPDP